MLLLLPVVVVELVAAGAEATALMACTSHTNTCPPNPADTSTGTCGQGRMAGQEGRAGEQGRKARRGG